MKDPKILGDCDSKHLPSVRKTSPTACREVHASVSPTYVRTTWYEGHGTKRDEWSDGTDSMASGFFRRSSHRNL